MGRICGTHEEKMHISFRWGHMKKRHHQVQVWECNIKMEPKKIRWEDMNRIFVVREGDKGRVPVHTVTKFRAPTSSGETSSFPRRDCVPWNYLRCISVHIYQFAVLYRHEQIIRTFHCCFLARMLGGQTHLAARVRQSPTWTADRPAAPAVPTSLQESLAKGD